MKPDEIRGTLLERRKEILQRVATIEKDFRHEDDPLSRDPEEQVAEVENDDVLDALDDRGRDELASIRRALERLESGEYGTCARCGQPIAPARLRALPTAELCIRCAEEAQS